MTVSSCRLPLLQEISGEGKKTLMQLVDEVTDYLKYEKHKNCRYRPFWDQETRTVALSQPYRLFFKLNRATGHWHVMDSSCVSSLPCILQTAVETLDPKHIEVTALQIVVEVFQDKEGTSHQTFVPYVVLIEFEVSKNYPPRLPKKLLPSTTSAPPQCVDNSTQDVGCLLCKHEDRDPILEDEPDDGEVSKLMQYDDSNITTHIHYVLVQHKSVAQLKHRVVPQCSVVASLLNPCIHKERTLQFVMVLQGNLFPVSSLFQVGGILRVHLPLRGSLPDRRANAAPDLRSLPWVQMPPDTAFFRHVCPLWPDLQPLADVRGMMHQTGNLYNRKTLNQNFETEKANKVDTPGFGVPGAKTVMLELRYGLTDSTCVYLNNWGNKIYPLGLLDGARITLTNVFRRTSARGSSYLVVNELTGITLHSLPAYRNVSSTWFPLTDVSLLSNLRAGSPVCGIVSAWKLLRVEFRHVCSCSAIRVHHVCPDVLCMAPVLSMRVEVRARIVTYGYGGPVLIHLKDDNVRRLLGINNEQWQVLANLSFKTEMVYNCSNNYNPEEHTFAQNIFHAFCYRPRVNTTLYVQCRKFASERAMQIYPEHNPKDTAPVPQIFAFEVKLSPPEGQLWG